MTATILQLTGYSKKEKMGQTSFKQRESRRVVLTESDEGFYDVVFIQNETIEWSIQGDMQELMIDMVRYWLEHDEHMFNDAYERWK